MYRGAIAVSVSDMFRETKAQSSYWLGEKAKNGSSKHPRNSWRLEKLQLQYLCAEGELVST